MRKRTNKLLSLLLAFIMTVQLFPVSAFADNVTDKSTRIADEPTVTSWQNNYSGNSTQFAGGVWTDKSVYDDKIITNAGSGNSVELTNEDDFLVSLAAIASTQSVTGQGRVPIDVMIILDLSSSMYNGFSNRNPDRVTKMVDTVNDSIAKILKLNTDNRVGITLYYGEGDVMEQSKNDKSGMTLLPLNRYTPTGEKNYISRTVSNQKLVSVESASGLKYEDGSEFTQKKRVIPTNAAAGTYAQKGILEAYEQFKNADTVTDSGIPRQPIFIFMSDGKPTAGAEAYTDRTADSTMGNNREKGRQPNEIDFVTQLTAAYAKAQVDIHYETYSPLFYSLGLTDEISLDVMDPSVDRNATIKGYWNSLISNDSMILTTYTYKNWSEVRNERNKPDTPSVARKYPVNKVALKDNSSFPSNINQMDYVDKYYNAATANNLAGVFEQIINDIELQTIFYPTLVEGDARFSGEVSFIDNIGEYMTVKEVKGLLIGDELYTGVNMARKFNSTDMNLNTVLGNEFFNSVKTKLGIDTAQTTTLIDAAYNAGQIRYNSDTNYSNYIGWFASSTQDGKMEYVAPWNDSMTVTVGDNGLVETPANAQGAKYYVKSYVYQGQIDESAGTDGNEAMYIIVWVRTEIATGKETVIFSVPASLIPTVEYKIELNEDGSVKSMLSVPVDNPIELVYEVGLRDDINQYNLYEKVSADYLAKHQDKETGVVTFYTNEFDVTDKNVNDGTINTYSYFRPSKENSRYYYNQNTPVLVKNPDGTFSQYTGTEKPSGEFYRENVYYVKDTVTGEITTEKEYIIISANNLNNAQNNGSNNWYIPKGNIHQNIDGYIRNKAGSLEDNNLTDTLDYSAKPFISFTSETNPDKDHITGNTHGNNGRIGLGAYTGVKVTKQLTQGTTLPDTNFGFTLEGPAGDKTLTIVKVEKNGTETKTTGSYTNGKYEFTLKADESVYVLDLVPGAYKLTEAETGDYKVTSIGGGTANPYDFTVKSNVVELINVTNTARGKGNLAITKQIVADDDAKNIFEREFELDIEFTGIGTANKTFDVQFTNINDTTTNTPPVTGTVTTDANGKVISYTKADTNGTKLTIGHGDIITILGLPEGTVAKVTETLATTDTNFVRTYELLGDTTGAVAEDKTNVTANIVRNTTADVGIRNTWNTTGLVTNMTLDIMKYLVNDSDGKPHDWPDNVSFDFVLEAYDVENGNWNIIGNSTVNKDTPNKKATFKDKDGNNVVVEFTKEGIYDFQVYETAKYVPNIGIDQKYYVFRVTVETNANGELYIPAYGVQLIENKTRDTARPVAEATLPYSLTVSQNNITGHFDFTNTYFDELDRPVTVTLDIFKQLIDKSGAGKTPDGFDFELYMSPECGENDTLKKYIENLEILDNGRKAIEIQDDVPTSQDGNGWIDLRFNKTGTYTFYLKETNDSKAGMTYSDRVLKVELEIGHTVTANTEPTVPANTEPTVPENTEPTVPANTEPTVPENTEPTVPENTEPTVPENTEPTVPENTEPTVPENTEPTVPENTEPTVPENTEPTVPENTEPTVPETTEPVVQPLAFKLMSNVPGEQPTEPAPVNETKDTTPTTAAKLLSYSITDITDATRTVDYKLVEMGGATSDYDFVIGKTTAEFVNTYDPTDTEVLLEATKTMVDDSGTPLELPAGIFTFKVTKNKVDGEQIGDDYTNGAGVLDETTGKYVAAIGKPEDGTITPIKIPLTTVGTHTFVIRETSTVTEGQRITYDKTPHTFIVEVADDNGELYVKSKTMTGTTAGSTVAKFENIKHPDEISYQIAGNKTIENINLTAGAFTFELYKANENGEIIDDVALMTTTNKADGSFVFDKLTFKNAGVYYYIVKEVDKNTEMPKYVFDPVDYIIKVDVTEDANNGNRLALNATFTNKDTATKADTLTFNNIYNPGSVSFAITGNKHLTNGELSAGQYTFELYETGADYVVGTNNPKESVKNITVGERNGIINFPEISYDISIFGGFSENYKDSTNSDVYKRSFYYVVKEQISTDYVPGVDGNIIYDNSEYQIKVDVEYNKATGKLTMTGPVIQKVGAASPSAGVVFTNNTIVLTNLVIEGRKVLTIENVKPNEEPNRVLRPEEFEFNLVEVDADGHEIEGGVKRTARNTVDDRKPTDEANNYTGKFVFDPIEYKYTDIGTKYYKITETIGTLGGITYDNAEYKVEVVVEDAGDGVLISRISKVNGEPLATDEEGVPINPIVFNNSYDNTKTELLIEGSKTLLGRDMKEGEFEFELTQVKLVNDEYKPVTGGLVQIVKNKAEGGFTFALAYENDDIGKEFTYQIREKYNNVDRVTYDDSVYIAEVSISGALLDINNPGKVKTDVTYYKLTEDGKQKRDNINFVNDFELEPGEVLIAGRKQWKGTDHPEHLMFKERFTFTIEALTEGAPLPDKEVTTYDSDGYIDFGKIKFDEKALDGKTSKEFKYQITEHGEAIYVTNDTPKTFTLTAKVDERTGIISITKDPAEGYLFTFVNTYENNDTPPPPDTGDTTDISFYSTVMIISALAIILVLIIIKRKNDNKDNT